MSDTTTTATTKSGMSTTKKVLIGTAIGLGALFIIGSIMPSSADTDTTPEPVAVVETVVETKPEPTVEPEPEVDEKFINEAAANIAWSDMDPVERQAICDMHALDAESTEAMAKATWTGQGLEAGLQKQMLKLIRTTC